MTPSERVALGIQISRAALQFRDAPTRATIKPPPDANLTHPASTR